MLRPLQETFEADDYPDLRVGLAAPDDAAVWRLDDERLLVMTTDFFTPVVDNPFDYGAIAAANSLSDIYAMGASPFMALNIACLPVDLPQDMVAEIFRGMAETVKSAGAVIAGGHTIQDQEPKVGLVVLGFAAPSQLLTKGALMPGDSLVLSKPLGTGVTATALKAGQADEDHVAGAIRWMKRLNVKAASLAHEHALRAATDVTGFGLLGHSLEMARASGVQLELEAVSVPLLEGALDYAGRGFIPGGSADNRSHFAGEVDFDEGIDEDLRTLLFDAQTSGGLLLGVPETQIEPLLANARQQGQPLWVIGRVGAGEGISVAKAGSVRASMDEMKDTVYWGE